MKNSERVIIVGVLTDELEDRFAYSMAELRNLVTTAGGTVITSLVQKRPTLDVKTLIGSGKLTELQALIIDNEIDLVIFNHEITPKQRQNLEENLAVRVIDRTQLILDIFALHARSKIGKLQVELAQIDYLLPQLKYMRTNLSRTGAGIGTRGPGETKLEQDRRHLLQQKHKIKQELLKKQKHLDIISDNRDDLGLKIGLIGYTNAGKTTLLNCLTNSGPTAENKLFATLDPLTKRFDWPNGLRTTITDTVGFIQDIPTTLVEAFKSTIMESSKMDFLLHVIDASSPNRLVEEQTVKELLAELKLTQIPIVSVYMKADLVTDFVPTTTPYILTSKDDENLQSKIITAIVKELKNKWQYEKIVVNIEDSYKIAAIKKQILVLNEEYDTSANNYQFEVLYPQSKAVILTKQNF